MTNNKHITTEEFDLRFDSGDDISDLVDWSKGKSLHGGKRLGAGRKVSGRKAYTFRLHPEIHERIQVQAQNKGISISDYIEELASH